MRALRLATFCVLPLCMSLNYAQAKLDGDAKKQSQVKLEEILMNKQLVAKVTFPASKDGIDLNIDGSWDNKEVTRSIKDKGVGIEIDEAATVTTVKLKDKHIEIHLNGGGYGTFGDVLLADINVNSAKRGGKQSGGSRINLRFNRNIELEDIDVKVIAKYLDPLVKTTGLAQDIAQQSIPEEFKEAAENGEIVTGMDKKTVYAIKGAPKEKNLNTDVSPPVEKWQYEISEFETQVVTFEDGVVAKIEIF